ncbi:hypothetical protein K1T71_002244 [Dendrolimus kikuchii]|uniref:Uncharacterized protein n=1 Tax=Dendrolimus kikuchii TaxID=765133 RepID=A0ACC1DDL2_9NEOP|nr:hypothetical protein K1T71_002244 [Dendrolimus kikuchii]
MKSIECSVNNSEPGSQKPTTTGTPRLSSRGRCYRSQRIEPRCNSRRGCAAVIRARRLRTRHSPGTMARLGLLVLPLLLLLVGRGGVDARASCTSKTYGAKSAYAVQLPSASLPLGVQAYNVQIPAAQACAREGATGVTLDACAVDEAPAVTFASMHSAVVERRGSVRASAQLGVTVHCVGPESADAPDAPLLISPRD